jgi:LmbE family N-acetylglucosaminyl deacetylase
VSQPWALHVSPHPDDEAVGCMGTITTLLDAGWRVTNLLTTLGREGEGARRLREAQAAAEAGGYQVEVAHQSVSASTEQFEKCVEIALEAQFALHTPDLVLSTTPHDIHPRHEQVGRAVSRVIRSAPGLRWWMYAIWGDLPAPTLYVELDDARLRRSLAVLAHYTGEIERQNYPALVEGRARAASVLGSEKIFGFGSGPASKEPFAELMAETTFDGNAWRPGQPRMLGDSPR